MSKEKLLYRELQKDLAGDRAVKWQMKLSVSKHKITCKGKNNSNRISTMLVNYLLPLMEEMLKFLDRVIQKYRLIAQQQSKMQVKC